MAVPQGLERIARIFAGIRSRSAFSVQCAIDAVNADGIAGTLIVQIPADSKKPVEVFFTSAPSQLVTEPWKLAG